MATGDERLVHFKAISTSLGSIQISTWLHTEIDIGANSLRAITAAWLDAS